MKKLLAIVLSIAMILVVAGCQDSTPAATTAAPTTAPSTVATEAPSVAPTEVPAEPVVLVGGSSGTLKGTLTGDAMYTEIDNLAATSSDNLTIDFYEAGALGGDAQIIEGVQSGSIDFYFGATSVLANTVPELAVLDIPGQFTTAEACNEMLKGGLLEMVQPKFAERGLYCVGLYAYMFRNMTTNKEINTAADLQGLKIRTMENQTHMAYWNALGASATPLAWPEVYVSLQQGTIDAQENPYGAINGGKLYEVQKYLYLTMHIPFVNVMCMNLDKYNSLSEQQKTWLNDWLANVAAGQTAANAQDEANMEATFTAAGMTIVKNPSAELLAHLKTGIPAAVEQVKTKLDAQFVDDFIASCEQYEAQYGKK